MQKITIETSEYLEKLIEGACDGDQRDELAATHISVSEAEHFRSLIEEN